MSDVAKQLRDRAGWETNNPAANDLLTAAREIEQLEMALKLRTDYAGKLEEAARELEQAVSKVNRYRDDGRHADVAAALVKVRTILLTGQQKSDSPQLISTPEGIVFEKRDGPPDGAPCSGESLPARTEPEYEAVGHQYGFPRHNGGTEWRNVRYWNGCYAETSREIFAIKENAVNSSKKED